MFKLLTLIIGGYLLYRLTINSEGLLSNRDSLEDFSQEEDDGDYIDYEEVD